MISILVTTSSQYSALCDKTGHQKLSDVSGTNMDSDDSFVNISINSDDDNDDSDDRYIEVNFEKYTFVFKTVMSRRWIWKCHANMNIHRIFFSYAHIYVYIYFFF